MAQVADEHNDLHGNVYTAILEAEEAKFARRGSRRPVLVASPGGHRDVRYVSTPPPLLANLRAGKPVELSDWQLPGWSRPQGVVIEKRIRVHPDGRIEDMYDFSPKNASQ